MKNELLEKTAYVSRIRLALNYAKQTLNSQELDGIVNKAWRQTKIEEIEAIETGSEPAEKK